MKMLSVFFAINFPKKWRGISPPFGGPGTHIVQPSNLAIALIIYRKIPLLSRHFCFIPNVLLLGLRRGGLGGQSFQHLMIVGIRLVLLLVAREPVG